MHAAEHAHCARSPSRNLPTAESGWLLPAECMGAAVQAAGWCCMQATHLWNFMVLGRSYRSCASTSALRAPSSLRARTAHSAHSSGGAA